MSVPRRLPRSARETRADRIIRFIETYLVVPEGMHVGQPIVLREWQKEIFRKVYDTPTRRAIVSMARKNGKTAILSMWILAVVAGPEARRNAQAYSTARSREQAAIVFGYAAKMVRMSKELNQIVVVRDSAKELYCPMTGVRYKALSSDHSTAMGLSPVFTVHDEAGMIRGPRDDLFDALETAAGANADPLSVIISTQAPSDGDLLSILIDDMKSGADPRNKLFLWSAPPDANPYSIEAMRAANPALDDFRSLEDLQETAERAKRLPSFEANYRNLCLNQRVASENHFLAPDVWKLNAGEADPAAFEEYPVYGGLDLSSVQDLTALVLVARDAKGVVHVRPEFWAPKGGLRERAARDRVPYDLWAEQGFLRTTPGNSVDYDFVAERLAEIKASCELRTVRFDRWNIKSLQQALAKRGVEIPLEPMGQGFRDQSPALKQLAALAVDGRLRHGGHPVLNFCAASAVVVRDPADNLKVARNRSSGRVDGIVALGMAIAGLGEAADPERPPAFQAFAFG